ncbi:hypothetical protein BJY01DRAFT_211867 [Aspergillus pseudoustus]|uniref:Uncharacterized protein n=1 Tax=Aspergillus pseudoustus TaxID=1810923 RepID=A0ABR4K868_9EURO
MSWAGFKKNVNRATTQVMMKTGMSHLEIRLAPQPHPRPTRRSADIVCPGLQGLGRG